MADALEVQIADAIVAELNDSARSWSGEFVAARRWDPVFEDVADLETVQVSVLMTTTLRERLDRSRDKLTYGLTMHFQRKVSVSAIDDMDALSSLVESVQDYLDDEHYLTGLADWRLGETERPLVYSMPLLHVERIWESQIDVTVWGYRAR